MAMVKTFAARRRASSAMIFGDGASESSARREFPWRWERGFRSRTSRVPSLIEARNLFWSVPTLMTGIIGSLALDKSAGSLD